MNEIAPERIRRIDVKKLLIIIFSLVGLAAIITIIVLVLSNIGIIGGGG
ncbi:MAG: hypothetical protein ACFE9C_11285 [Candidatus Hodarchaeota archaeon]